MPQLRFERSTRLDYISSAMDLDLIVDGVAVVEYQDHLVQEAEPDSSIDSIRPSWMRKQEGSVIVLGSANLTRDILKVVRSHTPYISHGAVHVLSDIEINPEIKVVPLSIRRALRPGTCGKCIRGQLSCPETRKRRVRSRRRNARKIPKFGMLLVCRILRDGM